MHRLDPGLFRRVESTEEDLELPRGCARGVPHEPPRRGDLLAEHDRLRRRVREFRETTPDPGPSFLQHQYGHLGHCTACKVHARARAQAAEGGWRDFGLVRQTFYDDFAIERSCGVVRRAGEGEKEGSVLQKDRPWEGPLPPLSPLAPAV